MSEPIKIELSGELIGPVEIHLARRVLDKVWPIAILVNKPFPNLTYCEPEPVFETDASMLADALVGSLPVGTLDRLIELLTRRRISADAENREPDEWL